MKKLIISAITALSFISLPALAASNDGWYGSLGAQYATDGAVDGSYNGMKADIKGKGGYGGYGALGYAFPNTHYRVEGEIGEFFAKGKDKEVSSYKLTKDKNRIWTGMVNGLYDFNRGGKLNPYLGLGLGVARTNVSLAAAMPSGTKLIGDDSYNSIAYQGIAGVSYNVNEKVSLDLKYKYLYSNDIKLQGNSLVDYKTAKGSFGKTGDSASIIGLGVTYKFAAAPVAPPVTPPPVTPPVTPPPAASCDGKSFVVYFDHNKYNLTDEASSVIDNAVGSVPSTCAYSAALIQGFTDTSGSAKYNIALSQKRVTVVSKALVAKGVPQDIMTGEAYGENKLAVQTADGVKEPLNRRTQVTLNFK